jgi:hypothetical protein
MANRNAQHVLGQITEPLKKKEGFRHLWLGDSGMGKTYANRILLAYIKKHKLADLIFTTDEKNKWEQQYAGTPRINPNHLRNNPPSGKEDKTHVVFRGVAATGDTANAIDYGNLAEMGWEISRYKPCSIVFNIDELSDATNGFQHFESDSVASLYRKGRSVSISIIAGTQMPQELPRAVFALSDTIVVFRMSGREVAYLVKYHIAVEEDIEIIQNLKVGEFRFFRKSFPRDTNVYKF